MADKKTPQQPQQTKPVENQFNAAQNQILRHARIAAQASAYLEERRRLLGY